MLTSSAAWSRSDTRSSTGCGWCRCTSGTPSRRTLIDGHRNGLDISALLPVLSTYLGSHVDLTVSSDALPGVTRHFDTFGAAATEAGLSRIYAGQHTRIDHDAGITLGTNVAHLVINHSTSSRI